MFVYFMPCKSSLFTANHPRRRVPVYIDARQGPKNRVSFVPPDCMGHSVLRQVTKGARTRCWRRKVHPAHRLPFRTFPLGYPLPARLSLSWCFPGKNERGRTHEIPRRLAVGVHTFAFSVARGQRKGIRSC